MSEYITQIKTFIEGLEVRQRIFLAGALLVATLSVVLVGVWTTSIPYRTLMSGRDYDEMLNAAAALDAGEIPYELSESGVLSVPESALGRGRAAIANANIVPGLADVEDLKLGLTPQAQDWAFLRAKEGDIAEMIGNISGISAARVSIVPREESLYFGDERAASASVMVKLKPGADLSSQQVSAVVNLVSHAVDGLDPGSVSVTDDRGALLAAGKAKESTEQSDPSGLTEYRTKLERKHERAVLNALRPILGSASEFSVTSSVELDLTSTQVSSKRVDVDNQAILSEQLDESNSQKNKPSGVPGVDSNLPERASTPAGSATSSETTRSTANYVYPTTDELTLKPAGGLKRLSVAVQINTSRIAELAESAGVTTASLQANITAAVEAAVGYNAARGDLVSVQYVPFSQTEWVDATDNFTLATVSESTLPYLLALVGLLLSFFMIVRPLMTVITRTGRPAETMVNEKGETIFRSDETAQDISSRLHDLVDNYEPVDATDLNRLVNKQTNVAAQVLRQWNRTT